MMYSINAHTCDIPSLQFSAQTPNLENALHVFDILKVAFNSVDVVESEETGEVYASMYHSVEVFDRMTTTHEALEKAVRFLNLVTK